MGNKMSKFTSSSEPGLDSTNIASSNEIPPFYRLTERNPSKTLRKVYAMYQPLNALFRIPIPGTLHWGVNVVSDEELAEDDPGYVWELAQEKGKITINVSSWTGAAKMRKELLGSTNLTDRKICDHASDVLRSMNTNELNILDQATRAYLIPVRLAHQLNHEDPKAYDPLIQNCQEFAKRLKERICIQKTTEPDKRKRRVIKKTGRFLKLIFVGSGKGFKKVGTGIFKRALISSLSNTQFIQPPPGR